MPQQISFGVMLLALVMSTALVPAAVQPSAETTPPKPPAANVQIAPSTLPSTSIENGIARLPLVASNQGADRARVWFQAVILDASGKRVDVGADGLWRNSQDWIQAGEIVPFTLTLRASPPADDWWPARPALKGHLAIETTSEAGQAIKTRKLEMRELVLLHMHRTLEAVALLGAGGCAVVALCIALFFRSGTAPEGPASWSSDSIGANVAVGAGLVSALFTVAALPQATVYSGRPTYGLVIAILTAVVALASPVANLLKKIFLTSIFSLFAAATLVLWGAIGQCVVVWSLVRELHYASAIATTTAWTLWLLDVGLAVVVTGYVIRAVARPESRQLDEATLRSATGARVGAAPPKQWAIP